METTNLDDTSSVVTLMNDTVSFSTRRSNAADVSTTEAGEKAPEPGTLSMSPMDTKMLTLMIYERSER